MKRHTNAAFSLIELLVVIAIIGVLAALLVPVVGGILESSKTSQCNSQLGQLAKAGTMYAGDNDDKLPTVDLWAPEFAAYLGAKWDTDTDPGADPEERGVFFCPTAYKLHRGDFNDNQHGSYGLNRTAAGGKIGTVAAKFKRVMMGDGAWAGSSWSKGLNPEMPEALHPKRADDGANLVFLDGHVEFSPEKEYKAGGSDFWNW